MTPPSTGRWIYPSESAEILKVSVKTVSRWAADGRLERCGVHVTRTLGGHRRLFRPDVEELARHLTQPATDPWNDEDGSS